MNGIAELQEIADLNPHDEALLALLLRRDGLWTLIIAERHSDGVIRHVDAPIQSYISPMLYNLRSARPEERAQYEKILSGIRGEGPTAH